MPRRLTAAVPTQGILVYYFSSVALLALAIIVNHSVFTIVSVAPNPSPDGPQTFSFAAISEQEYPTALIPPSHHPRNAALIMEESVHYAPNSTLEWESLIPVGTGGTVRLGPDKRLFAVSMFHQLQCLNELQKAVVRAQGGDSDSESTRQHVHHCLNYIRQMLLCAASVRLEPVKPTEGGRGADGFWLEHRCRDWTLLGKEVKHNYERWSTEHSSVSEAS